MKRVVGVLFGVAVAFAIIFVSKGDAAEPRGVEFSPATSLVSPGDIIPVPSDCEEEKCVCEEEETPCPPCPDCVLAEPDPDAVAPVIAFDPNLLADIEVLCKAVTPTAPTESDRAMTQAEMVHLLAVMTRLAPAVKEGEDLEARYWRELGLLLEAGFPAFIADHSPGCYVTAPYLARVLYHLATLVNDEFALRHGGLTTDEDKFKALIELGWLEAMPECVCVKVPALLGLLCSEEVVLKQEEPERPKISVIELINAEIEFPASPI